jgi:uncharacterized protein YcbK (DUF882 family)
MEVTYIRTKIRRHQEVQWCISCLYDISNSVATRLFKALHQAIQDKLGHHRHLRVTTRYRKVKTLNLLITS